MYDVFPYYAAKVISELPSFIIPPLLFTLITYFGIGFTQSVEQFFLFALNGGLNVVAGVSCGYLLSAGFTNPEIAI